ncbi:type II toxin-antitoxin system Phd/YefM family antitoxin [Leptolyngbya sp. 7M]|uniref:type II toxin-antitoxin system Phd/YefM family antitoxin n=1 Tax=Leptolyngbya sp. 7M TaxID=2812896 RepID=UPI001B8D6B33|nr:type II toxin-antitoxin system Phd/YefM family antitoxin [Leptolyngbya sp. 7M]QYO63228.1 type II toxin-antitoxin system Phd/YefM family antitoxin [Leptolyngbya sp. 7M]
MKQKTKTISASEFKAKCLQIFDTLGAEGIVVEKRGKPIAKVIPIRPNNSDWIGSMKGEIKILGDIMSTGIKWDAES